MNILKRVFDRLPRWPWSKTKTPTEVESDGGSAHLDLARESLRELIEDSRLPPGVRDAPLA